MLGAGLSILTSPWGWIVAISMKILHLAIVFVIWWLLRAEIAAFGVSEYIVLTLGILVVLYKELYGAILDLFLNFLVLITGGRFLRWMCNGYLSGKIVRQMQFRKAPMEQLVGCMVNIIPVEYRSRYEEIIDLYTNSDKPESEARLTRLLNEQSAQDGQ
jgi:hypothetical protein